MQTEKVPSKTKRDPRQVVGLVFLRKKSELQFPRYIGIEAWIAADRPEPAFVYDHPGALLDATISIGDAVYRNGIYHRTTLVDHSLVSEARHAIKPASKMVQVFDARGAFERINEVTLVEPEVSVKATGDGNRMSRGINKRSTKKQDDNESNESNKED